MPVWWVEIAQLLSTYGLWFALSAILIGIIIQYLIRPWITKVTKAFHKLFCAVDRIYEADTHPDRVDAKGNKALLTRRELFAAFEQSKACVVEIRSIKDTLAGKLCTEACPAFQSIANSLANREKHEKEFLDKLLELRHQTQNEIDENTERTKALYLRIHQFMDETLSKRELALDKRDEMLAKAMASLERLAADRKNGGK